MHSREVEEMQLIDGKQLIGLITSMDFVHVLGAGLNTERPAHHAVRDLSGRGWNPVPVHPTDAGGSIAGFPIRGTVEDGVPVEVIVLFLAPVRAREAVRKMLVSNYDRSPLVWFQEGAEDEIAEEWLNEAGWKFVKDDCIIRFLNRHELVNEQIAIPWFRQVQDDDDSGCSVWSVHEFKEDCDKPLTDLEWVGDLRDLEKSRLSIPNYIRGLRNEDESLEECARRLALGVQS